MSDPQHFCSKILREKHFSATAPPDERQLVIALIAFAGGGMNVIRESYPGIRIGTIANAVRAVAAGIRRGEVPEEIRQKFPELVAEQQAYAKSPAAVPTSAIIRKVKAIAKSVTKPAEGHLLKWLTRVKESFAPVAVPLTVEKLLEGVERGDPDMIKLSTQVFHLVPQSGKGLTLAQQFNLPGSQDKKLPAERRSPYFEKLLRGARQRIDSEESQTVEVTANEEEAEA